VTPNLLRSTDIETGAADHALPAWGRSVFRVFADQVLDERAAFPCVYAVEALKKSTLRFVFIEGGFEESSLWQLHGALLEYLKIFRSLDPPPLPPGKPGSREERHAVPGQHRLTSMIAFFAPDPDESLGVAAYEERFWHLVRFLHRHDPLPWPAEIPTEVEHERWEFCFGGEPIFLVCNTPAHEQRRSRRAKSFVVTFQPRWVFAAFEAERGTGMHARQVVRRRIVAYDGIGPSPTLGAYGVPGTREWKQYFLRDSNDVPRKCPFASGSSSRPSAGAAALPERVASRSLSRPPGPETD
jgi:FPC/CPF motif-containing protein YcgG